MACPPPIKILHESLGHTVSVEMTSGDIYRGHLMNIEDNMNCLLEGVTVSSWAGQISSLDQVYLRGSKVHFFALPDMLRNSPVFRKRGRGTGIGDYRGSGKGKGGGKGRGTGAPMRR
jgi:small nuclear ribonucleoprotein D3